MLTIQSAIFTQTAKNGNFNPNFSNIQIHDFVWIMGCAFQKQEMPNVILMMGIIEKNMLTKAILRPKKAISNTNGQYMKSALM